MDFAETDIIVAYSNVYWGPATHPIITLEERCPYMTFHVDRMKYILDLHSTSRIRRNTTDAAEPTLMGTFRIYREKNCPTIILCLTSYTVGFEYENNALSQLEAKLTPDQAHKSFLENDTKKNRLENFKLCLSNLGAFIPPQAKRLVLYSHVTYDTAPNGTWYKEFSKLADRTGRDFCIYQLPNPKVGKKLLPIIYNRKFHFTEINSEEKLDLAQALLDFEESEKRGDFLQRENAIPTSSSFVQKDGVQPGTSSEHAEKPSLSQEKKRPIFERKRKNAPVCEVRPIVRKIARTEEEEDGDQDFFEPSQTEESSQTEVVIHASQPDIIQPPQPEIIIEVENHTQSDLMVDLEAITPYQIMPDADDVESLGSESVSESEDSESSRALEDEPRYGNTFDDLIEGVHY